MPIRPVYLKRLRERRGYSQTLLATKSGIPQSHISKLERAPQKRGPIFATVVALARALGIEPSRLRFGPDPTRHRRRRVSPRPIEPPAVSL